MNYNISDEELSKLVSKYSMKDIADGNINGIGRNILRYLPNRLKAIQEKKRQGEYTLAESAYVEKIFEERKKGYYWNKKFNDANSGFRREDVQSVQNDLDYIINKYAIKDLSREAEIVQIPYTRKKSLYQKAAKTALSIAAGILLLVSNPTPTHNETIKQDLEDKVTISQIQDMPKNELIEEQKVIEPSYQTEPEQQKIIESESSSTLEETLEEDIKPHELTPEYLANEYPSLSNQFLKAYQEKQLKQDSTKLTELSQKYPGFADIFNRVYKNQRIQDSAEITQDNSNQNLYAQPIQEKGDIKTNEPKAPESNQKILEEIVETQDPDNKIAETNSSQSDASNQEELEKLTNDYPELSKIFSKAHRDNDKELIEGLNREYPSFSKSFNQAYYGTSQAEQEIDQATTVTVYKKPWFKRLPIVKKLSWWAKDVTTPFRLDLLLFKGEKGKEKYRNRFPILGKDSYHHEHPFQAVLTDLLVYSSIEALIGEGGAGAAESLGNEGIGGIGGKSSLLK